MGTPTSGALEVVVSDHADRATMLPLLKPRANKRSCYFLVALAAAAVVVVAGALVVRGAEGDSSHDAVDLRTSGDGVTSHALRSRPDWLDTGAATSGGLQLNLSFVVRPANGNLSKELLLNVSSPGHVMRNGYLTYDQLHALVAFPERTRTVRTWLEAAGVVVFTEGPHGHLIEASASVATWERLLAVKMGTFASAADGSLTIVRARGSRQAAWW